MLPGNLSLLILKYLVGRDVQLIPLFSCMQRWVIHSLVAPGNLLDGVCNSAYSERTEEFRGHNFADFLFATLGFIYLSEVALLHVNESTPILLESAIAYFS